MTDRPARWVAADEVRRKLARTFEPRPVIASSWDREPPMQVKFVLSLPGLGIGPAPAGGNNHGRLAEEALELLAGLLRVRVTLDSERVTLGDVGFACVIFIRERRNWWGEHDAFRVVRRAVGIVLRSIRQKLEPASERGRADAHHLRCAFLERAQRDKALVARVG